jgi:hypothetical protein
VSLANYYDESYPPSLWGGGGGGPLDPQITTLAPNTGSAAAGPITVTVTGSNFESGSVIEIDQVAQATTFVSATSLTTSYDPTVAGTVLFTVRNVNDEESNSVPFIVGAAAEEEPPPEEPPPEEPAL